MIIAYTYTYATKLTFSTFFSALKRAGTTRPVWNDGDKFNVTMSAGGHEIVVDLKTEFVLVENGSLVAFHASMHVHAFGLKKKIHRITFMIATREATTLMYTVTSWSP